MNYLLDTTVLIDYLRGRWPVVARLQELSAEGHMLLICAVNVAEVYSFVRPREEEATAEFLAGLTYVGIEREAGEMAGRWRMSLARQGVALHVPDALIGAVTRQEGAVLLTHNVRDFYLVPGLRMEQLPEPEA
jgi:tRNA(fMet)-specific endonuclease VapC